MATPVGAQPTWYLFRNSGEALPRASVRTDVVTTVLSVWFTLGLFLGVASASQGVLPAVTEFWTGMPIITGLLGRLLAAVMLPNPLPGNVPAASEAQTPTGS